MLVLDFALFQMFYCTEKTLVLVELASMANIFVIELALLLQNWEAGWRLKGLFSLLV